MVISIASDEDKMTYSEWAEYVSKKLEANWWENHKKLSLPYLLLKNRRFWEKFMFDHRLHAPLYNLVST
jgi:hypothetical protein